MIGVGIVTCNRENFFTNCINSIPKANFLMVVNDGNPYNKSVYTTKPDLIIEHKNNLGVAKSKNEIIKTLIEKSCDHIFLVEDDVSVKREDIYTHYIETAQKTGILHLNFAFHGNGNRDVNGKPVARKNIFKNGKAVLTLSRNLLGAFSYYHKSIIDKYGLIDERYLNGLEHVDHTYQIIKGCDHPPFWWFADAPNSLDYIEDQDDEHAKSIIRRNKIMWKIRSRRNFNIFKKKNGLLPSEILDVSEEFVEQKLDEILNNYSKSNQQI